MAHIDDEFPQWAAWFAWLRDQDVSQSTIEELELNPETGVYEPKHKQ